MIDRSKIKKMNLPVGDIDRDFYYLETGPLELKEKAVMARELFTEMSKPDTEIGSVLEKETKIIRADGSADIRHYDGAGGEEKYDDQSDYRASEHHKFFIAGPGRVWIAPVAANPYFRAAMTEGSLLIARNRDNMAAANIAASETDELKKALGLLSSRGFSFADMHILASVGPYQLRRAEETGRERAVKKEVYIENNIPEDNIMEFEFEESEAGPDKIGRNLAGVIANKQFIYKYSFDAKNFDDNKPPADVKGIKDEEVRGISNQ